MCLNFANFLTVNFGKGMSLYQLSRKKKVMHLHLSFFIFFIENLTSLFCKYRWMVADFKVMIPLQRISSSKSLMVWPKFLAVVSQLFIISVKWFNNEIAHWFPSNCIPMMLLVVTANQFAIQLFL